MDRFIASSYGSQQQLSRRRQAGIGEFGTQEQSRLAQGMSPKKITICEDETFHPETFLVAIEPVSNFILVEQYADRRDAKTWDHADEQALKGLPIEVAQARRERMREAIREIGAVYHPYDPANTRALPAEEVGRRVAAQFARIDRLAEDARLSQACQARIEKARRLIKSFVATIAFFHLRVRLWVSELALVPEVEQAVLNESILTLYLQRAAKKLPTAEERAKAAAVPESILTRLRELTGALGSLPPEERARVERVARDCADLLQRSSSCVEGRNGQLALRHHSLHRLPRGKLKALTVVHNYFVTRSDGTTAAERFFGAKPADLFSWLLDRLDVPARLAARRPKTMQKAA